MSETELEILDAVQLVLVNVSSSTSTFPPQWLPISLDPIPEDVPQPNILKLTDYVTDPDDNVLKNLTFSIYYISQSGFIDIVIEDSNHLSIYPKNDFDGTAQITIVARDDEHNTAMTTFDVKIIPANDLPVVDIVEPADNSKVYGMVEIIGSAYDPEGELAKVEIKIGNGDWEPVNGKTYWTYELDATAWYAQNKPLKEIHIKARAEDATGNQSFLDRIKVNISKTKVDTDGDGWTDNIDSYPNNPLDWKNSDSLDEYGDNTDAFPFDSTQWNDTDGDGYGDNPKGNSPDLFPYDPTQWEDLDGDGHGDNTWGNGGDFYPNDPEKWQKEGYEESSDEPDALAYGSAICFSGLVLIVIIIITALFGIQLLFKWLRTKKK
jgi:hypothetical protein